MLTDRVHLPVPVPFVGSSDWLQLAYQSLAPQATELQANGVNEDAESLRGELNFRRQLEDYLVTYYAELRKQVAEWERRADLARQQHGSDSRQFIDATRVANCMQDDITMLPLGSNRAAIAMLMRTLAE